LVIDSNQVLSMWKDVKCNSEMSQSFNTKKTKQCQFCDLVFFPQISKEKMTFEHTISFPLMARVCNWDKLTICSKTLSVSESQRFKNSEWRVCNCLSTTSWVVWKEHRFNIKQRREQKWLNRLQSFNVSANMIQIVFNRENTTIVSSWVMWTYSWKGEGEDVQKCYLVCTICTIVVLTNLKVLIFWVVTSETTRQQNFQRDKETVIEWIWKAIVMQNLRAIDVLSDRTKNSIWNQRAFHSVIRKRNQLTREIEIRKITQRRNVLHQTEVDDSNVSEIKRSQCCRQTWDNFPTSVCNRITSLVIGVKNQRMNEEM
jgi:hypothetical protein